jgi:WD40 repeat protein
MATKYYNAIAHGSSPYMTVYGQDGDTSIKLTDPSTLPSNTGNGSAWNNDSSLLAIAHRHSPYVSVYSRSVDTLTKISNPSTLPTGEGYAVAFSADGSFLAVAHSTSPYLTVYTVSGSTLTKISNPSTLPTGSGLGLSWSPDGGFLAVTHSNSPFMTVYSVSGSTLTKISDPSTLTGNYLSYEPAWSPDGSMLAVAHFSSPYVTIYSLSGTTLTKLSNPSTLPSGECQSVAWSPDGGFLAVGSNVYPRLDVYTVSGSTFTRISNPSTLPTGTGNGVSWSPDGDYLSVAEASSPYALIYSLSGTTLTKLANPASLPAGVGNFTAYSGSLNAAPTAPTWVAPADNSYQDRDAVLLLDWDFADPDGSDTQSAYALSKSVDGAALEYWNAGTSAWVGAEVQNITTDTSTTLPIEWADQSGIAEYKVKTWDAADAEGPYSLGLTINIEGASGIFGDLTASASGTIVEAITYGVASGIFGTLTASASGTISETGVVIATTTSIDGLAHNNSRTTARTSTGRQWQAFNSGTQLEFWYSDDNWATKTQNTSATFTATASMGFGFFIDIDDHAHVSYGTNGDDGYYKRMADIGPSTSWNTAYLISGTHAEYTDVVAFRDGESWLAAVSAGRDDYDYMLVWVFRVGDFTTSLEQSIQYGPDEYIYASIDFNHTGDGLTVADSAPHIYMSGVDETVLGFRKAVYSGGSWTLNPTRVIDPSGDQKYGRHSSIFDGTRFVMAWGDNTLVYVSERDAADTTTTSLGTLPAYSDGEIYNIAVTYDADKNVHVWAAGTTSDDLKRIMYDRATSAWDASWTLVHTGTVVIDSLSLKRGHSNSMHEATFLDGATSPYNVMTASLSLNAAPTAPTWSAPADNSYQNRDESLTLDWDFNDGDAGDSQSAYALSKSVDGAALEYWNAGTSSWVGSQFQNIITETSATLPIEWAVDGESVEYKVKTWDGHNDSAPYSLGLTINPGSASGTFGALTASASGTVAEAVIATSASIDLGALTASASGIVSISGVAVGGFRLALNDMSGGILPDMSGAQLSAMMASFGGLTGSFLATVEETVVGFAYGSSEGSEDTVNDMSGGDVVDTSGDEVLAMEPGDFGGLTASASGIVSISGTASGIFGDLTASASGTIVEAITSGSASINLGALTASSSGTVLTIGVASATFGALTASASGTVVEAITSGSASSTLGALIANASAELTTFALASIDLGALTASASGTVVEAITSGTASINLGALTASSSGTVLTIGVASATFGALTASASGTVIEAVIATSASINLGALTASALGTVIEAITSGSASIDLGALTASSSGTVIEAITSGSASIDLGALTASASGTVIEVITYGLASATLGALTASASGTIVEAITYGVASATFGGLIGNASTELTTFALASIDLRTLVGNVSANILEAITIGTAVSTLGALTLTGTATLTTLAISTTIFDFTGTATGEVKSLGTANSGLGSFTGTAIAIVIIVGSLFYNQAGIALGVYDNTGERVKVYDGTGTIID